MRINTVAGNWKMNIGKEAGQKLLNEIAAGAGSVGGSRLIVCPPFPHLPATVAAVNVGSGAQNCSDKTGGAFTGEVSAEILASFGVEYVILGHSERRQYFKETGAELAAKTDRVLENKMTPIFCCGETLAEREAGGFEDLVCGQIADGLFHLSAEVFENVIVAYEPVWAIGTGVTASSAQAQEMHAVIRTFIAKKYGQKTADNTTILYGGSCKPDNAEELFACPDVDGGLIGGASLKAGDFLAIAGSF